MLTILKDDDYSASLEAYYQNSDEVVEAKRYFHVFIPSFLGELLQDEQNGPINILGVGSGNGEYDMGIIEVITYEQVRQNFDRGIFHRALEPNKSQIEKFQNSPKLKNLVLDKNATLYFNNISFEEYMASPLDAKNTFDLVHFIQSLYYFADIENTLLDTFHRLLKAHGKIFIIVTGNDIVSQVFLKQCHLLPKDATSIVFEDILLNIQNIAEKYKWKYYIHTQEYHLDVTKLFDAQSREGNLFLDSLTSIKNYRSSVDIKEVNETLELVERNIETLKNERSLCKRVFHFIVISKN